MARISRSAYANMFGPTTGDRLRLADTDLIVEVEKGGKLGPAAEKLFDMYKRNNDGMTKRLAQDMLYYYSLFRKYYTLSMQRRKGC